MKASYADQVGLFDPATFGLPVHIIGMGGIGSALFYTLLKLGVHEVHIWDRDEVEPHNIPCQMVYRPSDIGTSKVLAAQAFAVRQEVDCEVVPHDEFVTADTPLEGIVISGVDSMLSRQAIWQAVKQNYPFVSFYMDGRIGGEELHLLSPDGPDAQATQDGFVPNEWYEKTWLFNDDEGAELPCGFRTCIHPPVTLAGWIIANLTLFIRKEDVKRAIHMHMKTMNYHAPDVFTRF